jgi:protein involved in plasmid replication-relaxation
VAAGLDRNRRPLDWRRRDDWASHPQLAHRLAVNRFATDLVAATLADRTLGVAVWFGPRQAAARLGERMRGAVRPDAELLLATPAGAPDWLLEWDRGTEPLDRLDEKVRRYRMAERKVYWEDDGVRRILFVGPGQRRLDNLRELCTQLDREGSWPVLATQKRELAAAGRLAAIWQRLDAPMPPAAQAARCQRHPALLCRRTRAGSPSRSPPTWSRSNRRRRRCRPGRARGFRREVGAPASR